MAHGNSIKLFDLQFASGATTSPYVWRIKYALKHKGFDIDLVEGGFTDILKRTEGRSDRLPVIVDGDRWVLDSMVIADYLDEQYPDRPLLFPYKPYKPAMRFLDTWIWDTVIKAWFDNYIADYHDLSRPEDQAYVRETRTRFVAADTLEEAQAGREERLPHMPARLDPLRTLLQETPWIGGDQPDFWDYSALSVFLWLASLATTPPLTDDDPLRDWLDRGFDLFDGIGRHPGLHSLFGLQLRPGDPEPFQRGGLGQAITPTNVGPGAEVKPRD